MHYNKFWYISDKSVRKGDSLNATERKSYKRMNPLKENDELYFLSIDCDETAVKEVGKKIDQKYGENKIPQIWITGTDNEEKKEVVGSGSLLIPLKNCKNTQGEIGNVNHDIFVFIVRKISYECGGDLLHVGRAFKNPEYHAHKIERYDEWQIDFHELVRIIFEKKIDYIDFKIGFKHLRSYEFLKKLEKLRKKVENGEEVKNVENKVSNYKSNIQKQHRDKMENELELIRELGYQTDIIYSRKSVWKESERVANEILQSEGYSNNTDVDKLVLKIKRKMRENPSVRINEDWQKEFHQIVVNAVKYAIKQEGVLQRVKKGERLTHFKKNLYEKPKYLQYAKSGFRDKTATQQSEKVSNEYNNTFNDNIEDILENAESLGSKADAVLEEINRIIESEVKDDYR